MGYFKNTLYYGPNCQDLSDHSPEALTEQVQTQNALRASGVASQQNYRVIYRRRFTDDHQEQYFDTNREARAFFRQKRADGYIGAVQYWNVREKMWIG